MQFYMAWQDGAVDVGAAVLAHWSGSHSEATRLLFSDAVMMMDIGRPH